MQDKFRTFAALHVPGDPLILYNAWDAGSARAVASAGAKAIATGSWSVAAAQAYGDGEGLPLEIALAGATRIAGAVDLPVSIDFEGGYAVEPEAVAANASRLAATGAIGCNFEDQVVGGEGLHPVDFQVARIAAMRAATGPSFFINARTDIFLQNAPATHDEEKADTAIARGKAYADAGASGFFRARAGRPRAAGQGLPRSIAAGQFHGLSRRTGCPGGGWCWRRADQPWAEPLSHRDGRTDCGGAGSVRLALSASLTLPPRPRPQHHPRRGRDSRTRPRPGR